MDKLTLTIRFVSEPVRKGVVTPDNARQVAEEVFAHLTNVFPSARIQVEAASRNGPGAFIDTADE